MAWEYTLGDGYYYGHMGSAANNSAYIKEFYENQGGFTPESIVGMIANIDHESYLNPAQGEHGKHMSDDYGYGLYMWTPAKTKILAYADHDPLGRPWYDGTLQLEFSLSNIPQTWIKSQAYPYSWEEYKQITDYNLATRVFFYNFERGTWHDELDTYTSYWADTLYGDTPPTPDPPLPPSPEEEDEDLAVWLIMKLTKLFG